MYHVYQVQNMPKAADLSLAASQGVFRIETFEMVQQAAIVGCVVTSVGQNSVSNTKVLKHLEGHLSQILTSMSNKHLHQGQGYHNELALVNEQNHGGKELMTIASSPAIIDGVETTLVRSQKVLHFIASHCIDSPDVTMKCAVGRRFGCWVQVCEDLYKLVVLDNLVRSVMMSNPLNQFESEFALVVLLRDLLIDGELHKTFTMF